MFAQSTFNFTKPKCSTYCYFHLVLFPLFSRKLIFENLKTKTNDLHKQKPNNCQYSNNVTEDNPSVTFFHRLAINKVSSPFQTI